MPELQLLDAASAALFNEFGAGRVHMDTFGVRPPPSPATLARRARRRRQLMRTKLLSRFVRGSLASPTIVATGSGTDYQAVDGLDVTVDQDSDACLIDFAVAIAAAADPGTIRIAVNVDNAVDLTQICELTTAETVNQQVSGQFALNVGPGPHRYRLFATCTNATTLTLTAQNRSMRVTGLILQA